MNNPICNTVFDSRDLIEYIEELKGEILILWNDYVNEKPEYEQGNYNIDDYTYIDFEDEEFCEINYVELEEFNKILEFVQDLETCDDYQYGMTIIHENYFKEYAEEYLESCYEIPDFLWSYIDVSKFADDLGMDFFEFEYDGETYYARG